MLLLMEQEEEGIRTGSIDDDDYQGGRQGDNRESAPGGFVEPQAEC